MKSSVLYVRLALCPVREQALTPLFFPSSVTPIYATILFTLGTLSGRHAYFAGQWRKILNRFLPTSAINKVVPASCPSGKPPRA